MIVLLTIPMALPNISVDIKDKNGYFHCQYCILIVLLVHFTFYA